MSKNKTTDLTKELLEIASLKFYNKDYDKLDMMQKNYCAKYVLNYINETDALKTNIEKEVVWKNSEKV